MWVGRKREIIKCIPRSKLASKKWQVRIQEDRFLQIYNTQFQKLIKTSVELEMFVPRSWNTSNCWFWCNSQEEDELAWGETRSMVWTYRPVVRMDQVPWSSTNQNWWSQGKYQKREQSKNKDRARTKQYKEKQTHSQPRGLWSSSETLKKFPGIPGW